MIHKILFEMEKSGRNWVDDIRSFTEIKGLNFSKVEEKLNSWILMAWGSNCPQCMPEPSERLTQEKFNIFIMPLMPKIRLLANHPREGNVVRLAVETTDINGNIIVLHEERA